MTRNIVARYTKDELETILEQSSSISDFMKRLGYANYQGNSRNTVKKNIEKFGLSEKFESLKIKGLKTSFQKIKNIAISQALNPEEILTENSDINRTTLKRVILRNKLIEYKCQRCGNEANWLGESLTLQLHHINGNSRDNRLENLCWLCPNCHSQTDNFGSKNSSVVREKELQKQIEKQKRDIAKQNFIEERKKYFDSIDTTKWGWLSKAGRDLGISHSQARRWLIKYYPQILEQKK